MQGQGLCPRGELWVLVGVGREAARPPPPADRHAQRRTGTWDGGTFCSFGVQCV